MDKSLNDVHLTQKETVWEQRYQNLIDSVKKWPKDMGKHFSELAKVHTVLNESHSEIVAHSVMALVVYEDYLLNKTDSQELAKAMSNLKSSLPGNNSKEKQHAKFVRKIRQRNTAPRIVSKRRSQRKGGKTPPKIDGP